MREKLQTIVYALRQRWFVHVLILLGVAFIIGAIFSVLTPTPPPNPDNQWNGVAPGYLFSEKQVAQTLGEPLSTTETALGTERTYKSDFPIIPHEVVTDKKNRVVLIKEQLPPNATETVTDYEKRLGTTSLSLYVAEAVSAQAHVFLKTGLILISYSTDNVVREKWYITPTTEELFWKQWEGSFTKEPSSHPEPAPPEEPPY